MATAWRAGAWHRAQEISTAIQRTLWVLAIYPHRFRVEVGLLEETVKLHQKTKAKHTVSKLAKRVRPKTVRYLRKLAWNLLSRIIRQTAADHAGNVICYTCGEIHPWKEIQAGHAIGGRHNAVLLDEEIIRPQCCGCNIFRRGNYPVFAAKLVREHGIDWWERKLEESHQLKTYTRGDLEALIESYRERLSHVENPGAVFDKLDGINKVSEE